MSGHVLLHEFKEFHFCDKLEYGEAECIGCDIASEIARLRAGIIKARDALYRYDQQRQIISEPDTFDIASDLDELLGDTE